MHKCMCAHAHTHIETYVLVPFFLKGSFIFVENVINLFIPRVGCLMNYLCEEREIHCAVSMI